MTPEDFAALPKSRQIRIAIDDLEAKSKDDNYTIDMNRWHHQCLELPGQPCAICLFGSVVTRWIDPSDSWSTWLRTNEERNPRIIDDSMGWINGFEDKISEKSGKYDVIGRDAWISTARQLWSEMYDKVLIVEIRINDGWVAERKEFDAAMKEFSSSASETAKDETIYIDRAEAIWHELRILERVRGHMTPHELTGDDKIHLPRMKFHKKPREWTMKAER